MPGEFLGIVWAKNNKHAAEKAKETFGVTDEFLITDLYGPAPKAYAVWRSGVKIPTPPTAPERVTPTAPPPGAGAPPLKVEFIPYTTGEEVMEIPITIT